jgi:hypothetical protein
VKYLLLIHSNPVTWGHPSFLHTEEGIKLPKSAREEIAARIPEAEFFAVELRPIDQG